ncbi:hypothetical protein [Bacteroides sp. 224]|uniref:hypothetical protein n=1 Tax=Bacteroides sp. 224 TaxID=2302936 RepID=UPI0013D2F70C|nr:hypothetical protein [Bacteroides sp. 224]NDV66496.1 hypothetical protein [Bacteroides sp. 224]
MKKLFLQFAIMGVIIGGLISCESESSFMIDEKETSEGKMVVEFILPTNSLPQTRAVDATDENKIVDIYALAFSKANKTYLGYQKIGTPANASGSEGRRAFVMNAFNKAANTADEKHAAITEDIFLVFLANVGITGLTIDTDTYATVRNKFIINTESNWSRPEENSNWKGIPMYGETDSFSPNTKESLPVIYLIRSMARVEVRFAGIGEADNKFTPEQLYLYNVSKNTVVMPEKTKLNANKNKVLDVSVEDELFYHVTAENTYKLLPESYSTVFFIPERKAYIGETDWTKNFAIIIKGTYDGNPSYYRVDIKDQKKNTLPILRNHNYVVTVRRIKEIGRDSKGKALETEHTNTDADITCNSGEILYTRSYGHRMLGVNQIEFHRDAEAQNLRDNTKAGGEKYTTYLKVSSLNFEDDATGTSTGTADKWKYKFVDENGNNTSVGWIKIDDYDTEQEFPTVRLEKFTSSKVYDTRTAYIRIYSEELGERLYIDVKIVQHYPGLFKRENNSKIKKNWLVNHTYGTGLVMNFATPVAVALVEDPYGVIVGFPLRVDEKVEDDYGAPFVPGEKTLFHIRTTNGWYLEPEKNEIKAKLGFRSFLDPAFYAEHEMEFFRTIKINGYYISPVIPEFENNDYKYGAHELKLGDLPRETSYPTWYQAMGKDDPAPYNYTNPQKGCPHLPTTDNTQATGDWKLPTLAEAYAIFGVAGTNDFNEQMINFWHTFAETNFPLQSPRPYLTLEHWESANNGTGDRVGEFWLQDQMIVDGQAIGDNKRILRLLLKPGNTKVSYHDGDDHMSLPMGVKSPAPPLPGTTTTRFSYFCIRKAK